MKPAPNSLAILRACRQVNREAGGLRLSQVLFSFESVEDMLDKLSVIPLTTLSQIRHVRVGGRPLVLQPIGDDDDVYYRLTWALKLLPGLRLDTLTVLGSFKGEIGDDTLTGLISRHGNGWREHRFITPNSQMLGFARINIFMMGPYWRKPQPSNWSDIFLERDGANSEYPSLFMGSHSLMHRALSSTPHTSQIFEQKPSRKKSRRFGIFEDKELPGSEANKELLVVVKRGRHADIVEQDGPPYLTRKTFGNGHVA